jgi:hypothetical protein
MLVVRDAYVDTHQIRFGSPIEIYINCQARTGLQSTVEVAIQVGDFQKISEFVITADSITIGGHYAHITTCLGGDQK